jgi:phospholipid-binding lipoprotein MlaA
VSKRLVMVLALTFFAWPGGTTPASAFDDELPLLLAQQDQVSSGDISAADEDADDAYDEYDEYDEEPVQLIGDPVSGFNRGIYHFNDKLYFWLLKPIARGYGFIIPQELRLAIHNVYYNIRFPVRFINCLLQGKMRKAGGEFGRFFINTTVGFLGLADVAQNYPALNPSKEDLGQTFAVWGVGWGPYLTLPFLGPSSTRDLVGLVGDSFLDPIWWFFWFYEDFWLSTGTRGVEVVNDVSMRIGEYEALKKAALDPYIAIRNGWVQYRQRLIED